MDLLYDCHRMGLESGLLVKVQLTACLRFGSVIRMPSRYFDTIQNIS